jgi:radical SAM superfamily enzyme YgiQ (UPF0313 family)
VPSSPPAEPPLVRFALPDGRPATLLAGEASTVLSIEDVIVSSWDLAGRPYALVRDTGTYRRGLDGRLLWKREATADGRRLRRRLSAAEGEPIVEAARLEAAAGLEACPSEAARRLRPVVAQDADALRRDAERFLAASGPVGILPPDQYLSLVVRVTEGCSWNACTFCSLYRDVPFRWKRPLELRAHLAALREYFGASIALRRSVFLGDANALCLPHDRLFPLVEAVAAEFAGAPLFSFLDAWTGRRRTVAEWRDYARLGLKRVYVGLETGDPGLLAWLEKPGSPRDVVDLVGALHEAGIGAGVVVLLGAGGERFAKSHATCTTEALNAMRLGAEDLVYFSEYVDDPALAYGQRAAGAGDLRPLLSERCADQRRAIVDGIRGAPGARPPRHATYDIREFVY